METTPSPTIPSETPVPVWLVVAAATVAAAAALAGHAFAATPAPQERPVAVALPGGCDDWGCGMNHNEVLASTSLS